jgi:hypothetical protein
MTPISACRDPIEPAVRFEIFAVADLISSKRLFKQLPEQKYRSCSSRSLSSTNVRPGKKLRRKYFTPDSTLPFVWARYG